MDYLEIIDAQGRRLHVRLDRPRFLIGREATCDICLPHPNVGRRHAQLQRDDQGAWLLQDLNSLNHVYYNEQPIQQVVLEPGKQVRIGEFRLALKPALGEVVEAPSSCSDIGPCLQVLRMQAASVTEECQRIWEELQTNHVLYERADPSGLPGEVLDPLSPVREALARGFHSLVVLDAASGLDERGLFQLGRFFKVIREAVAKTFDLPLQEDTSHIEDVYQTLKDENRSLFCFVNVQLIPVALFAPVRGFTQGIHKVLLLSCGDRDLTAEERALRNAPSGVPDSLASEVAVSHAPAPTLHTQASASPPVKPLPSRTPDPGSAGESGGGGGPCPVELLIYERASPEKPPQLVATMPLRGRAELGRQETTAETLYSSAWREAERYWRVVIARGTEQTIGRHHVLVEPLPDGHLQLTNTSVRSTVQIDNGPSLARGVPHQTDLPAGGLVVWLGSSRIVRLQLRAEPDEGGSMSLAPSILAGA